MLTLASREDTVSKGAALLFIYSLGLGLPFIISGLGLARLQTTFGWIKRHYRPINVVSGLLLAIFGVLLFTDRLTLIASHATNFFDTHHLSWILR